MSNNPYLERGFASRAEYLKSLSEEYEVGIEEVQAIADLLGPTEDFDGLVSALEDFTS
jgi:hypothetical protein